MVKKTIIVIRMIKNTEAMLELTTKNIGGWKDFIEEEVGLSSILLCYTQYQQRVDFILNAANDHTCY